MKDPKAAAVIRMRLKYDWIVLIYGGFCILIQLIGKGDWEYFFILISVFVFTEVFTAGAYRKLQAGGEGYHVHSRQSLDQSTGVGLILFCMIFDVAILFGVSLGYFLHAFKTG
jgi:hypothetical protein